MFILGSLGLHFAAIAKQVDQPTAVSVKGSVPVNYYEAFMISIAVIYGIYLFVRAKRRKRNQNVTN